MFVCVCAVSAVWADVVPPQAGHEMFRSCRLREHWSHVDSTIRLTAERGDRLRNSWIEQLKLNFEERIYTEVIYCHMTGLDLSDCFRFRQTHIISLCICTMDSFFWDVAKNRYEYIISVFMTAATYTVFISQKYITHILNDCETVNIPCSKTKEKKAEHGLHRNTKEKKQCKSHIFIQFSSIQIVTEVISWIFNLVQV